MTLEYLVNSYTEEGNITEKLKGKDFICNADVRQTVRQGCSKTDVEKIESRRPKMFHCDSHEIPEGFQCPDGKII